MPKQTLQIDVPEGWRIAAYRTPLEGEYYLNDSEAVEAMADFVDDRLVLVADWRWPSWLKAGWIAKCELGEWKAFNECPMRSDFHNEWFSVLDAYGTLLHPDMFRFDPPPCDDWKQSLRQNPAYIRGDE